MIPPRYDAAWEFVDGLALVQLDDVWCYINTAGGVVAWKVGASVFSGPIWSAPR